MSDAKLLTLAELPADYPMPLIERRRVMGEKMMISEVRLSTGFEVPSHRHENEQFVVVLSGRCRFTIGEAGTREARQMEVRAGQVLHLPPNVWHGCTALEETKILDLFAPPSATTGVDVKR